MGSNITNCNVGVWFICSSTNRFSGNTPTNNLGIALHFFGSLNNIPVGNNIANNTDGFSIHRGSDDNLIFHNNLVNNWITGSISSSDYTWDEGYHSGGNCWSNYASNYVDGDSIGDDPYVIDANNEDRYPLMELWSVPTMIKSLAKKLPFRICLKERKIISQVNW